MYSSTGQPSMPIRLMLGCLFLKRLYNYGDETLAKAWIMNPYMQYFCGEAHFRHSFPCDPSDFTHFRKRIGKEGIEKIFAYSVELHGKQVKSKAVLSDTTVQENNISFPTASKLAKKVIDRCNSIAKRGCVKQRQSYKRISKQLLRDTYNSTHPKRRKKATKSQRKLCTLASRQIRELERKLPIEILFRHKEQFALFRQAITQQLYDKNKRYSLHKPFTACIAKGKAHKKYEFGNKAGLILNPKSLVILAIDSFMGNPHDSRTIEPLLTQMKEQLDYQPAEVVYDRGGKGKSFINGVKISTPGKVLKTDTAYQRIKKRKKFRRRAKIKSVIGYLKQHFRLGQNYLHGAQSLKINAFLAATGWNLKKLMEKLEDKFLWLQNLYRFLLNSHQKRMLLAGIKEGLDRASIFAKQTSDKTQLFGEIELDKAYFGCKRLRGVSMPQQQGRGTWKQAVFGVFERGGRVYTELIPAAKQLTLRKLIRGKINLTSILYSDGWRGYNGLLDMDYNKHFRINKSKNFSNKNGVHINGIESFWRFTKRRLAKFNGVKSTFELHLKECAWRKSTREMEKELWKMVRKK